jgi:hypothetical protein
VWVVTHLYAGLALAQLPLPLWVLVLVMLASHVVMDLIPHWDYTRTRHAMLWGALDFGAGLLTVIVGYWTLGASPRVLLLGVLAAAPDFDVLLNGRHGRYWFPSHRPPFPHGACGPLPGIAVQAVIVAAAGTVLALG